MASYMLLQNAMHKLVSRRLTAFFRFLCGGFSATTKKNGKKRSGHARLYSRNQLLTSVTQIIFLYYREDTRIY